ncbi:MAG: threonine ammonia-lyase IlvA [Paracoccaceae bacterium]|nr:threonine ammonia-lyase IlvA [Paracoccaceae bacterium]
MSDFIKNVEIATESMRALFPETPLQKNEFLSEKYEAEVFLKREDLSPVRSYKIRGALNSIKKALTQNSDIKNFVCASAGNHAQGVAFVCKYLNKHGYIFMPVTTPEQKIDKTRSFGGENIEIRLTGDYFDTTLKSAIEFSRKNDAIFLPPFDSYAVIEGQATVLKEILNQSGPTKQPDFIFLAVGGGGLSAGMLKYSKAVRSGISFRLVEPFGAASLNASLLQGKQITLDRVNNFVDGAAVARIGNLNFEILKDFSLDNILTVTEDRLCVTMMEMLNTEGIVLEPAGALSIDGLKDIDKSLLKGKRVVCVVSGGNFDFERLPDVKERALRFSGKKKYLVLRMPQRPGALKEFLSLLGPDDDIARFEYLKKSARNFGSVLLGIETTDDRNFDILFKKMEKFGFGYQDITENEALTEFIV